MACLTTMPPICLDDWRTTAGRLDCKRRATTLLERYGALEFMMKTRGYSYWRCGTHLMEHVFVAGDPGWFVVWQA